MNKHAFAGPAVMIAALMLGGCSVKVLEADKRIVSFTTKQEQVGQEWNEFEVVCPEASPDALTLIAGSISGETEAGVNLAAAYSENGSNIGLRTHTIQILRDQLYAICQGYANRGLSAFAYQSLLARNQRNTVILMTIEQLTGVLKTPEVNITTTATADAASLTRQSEEIETLKEKYKAMDKASEEGKNTAKNIAALEEHLKNARGSLAKASGTEKSTQQQSNPALDPASVTAVVDAVKELALSITKEGASEDNLMTCMQHLQTARTTPGTTISTATLEKACSNLVLAMASKAEEVQKLGSKAATEAISGKPTATSSAAIYKILSDQERGQ
nr:hypothetical protein [uncultured Pseudomonas sp.]